MRIPALLYDSRMRKLHLLPLLLGLACDRGSAAGEAKTKDAPEEPSAEVSRSEAAPKQGEADAAKALEVADAPSAQLPKHTASVNEALPEYAAIVWIDSSGIWVGTTNGDVAKVLPLEGARLPDDAPEILEPLAKALHELPQPDAEIFLVGVAPRRESIVLRADHRTDASTIRRVVTTARVTGYGGLHLATQGESSLLFRVPSPIQRDRFLDPLHVQLKADGTVRVNSVPMDRSEAAQRIERTLELMDIRCATFDAEGGVGYDAWAEFAGWLAERKVECLAVRSPAVGGDFREVPPPPPPPAVEDEGDDAPEPEPAPTPEPKAKPEHPAKARAEFWWGQASEAAEARSEARCKVILETQRAAFTAKASPDGEAMKRMARVEDDCGEATRAAELRRLRTETFPEDWRSWFDLALHEFGPLWPDLEAGKPYNAKIDAKERHAIATRVIESLEKAAALAPTQRDVHVWLAMAYTQRSLARPEGSHPEGEFDLEGRVDRMKAWTHRKAQCDMDGIPACPSTGGMACCPAPPSTEEAHAADMAELAKRGH